MGIDPEWLGYLNYCADFGLGNFDIAKIDVVGAKIADVRRNTSLHADIERQLSGVAP